jgi:hypothetical protein
MRQQPRVMRANELTGHTGGAGLPLGNDAFLSPLHDTFVARKPRRFGRLAIFVLAGAALVSTSMVATAWMVRASRASTPSSVAVQPAVASAPLQLAAAATPVLAPSPSAALPVQARAEIVATSTLRPSSDLTLGEENEATPTPVPRHRRASKRSAAHRDHATTRVAHEQSTRDDIVADLLQTTPQHGTASHRDTHRSSRAQRASQGARSRGSKG